MEWFAMFRKYESKKGGCINAIVLKLKLLVKL